MRLLYQLIPKTNNQGFVLPLILGMGLVMSVAATAIIVSTQGKQKQVFAQERINNVNSVAELGITRYKQLLVQHPQLATYCANPSTETPCNSGKTWSNITANEIEINSSTASSCSTTTELITTSSTSTVTNIQNLANVSTWHNVDDDNLSLGQYKLVNYIYEPITDQRGTGILTVEGRFKAKNSLKEATSRLQIRIPISKEENFGSSSSGGVPGLWIRWNQQTDVSGSVQLQTNIKDSTCPEDTDNHRVTKVENYMTNVPPEYLKAQYIQTPGEAFPPLPEEGKTPPTGSGVYHISGVDNDTVMLPQSGESAVDGVLTYHIGDGSGKSIELSSGSNLQVGTGHETVVLHVDGDMDISGGGNIQIADGSKLIIYAHGKVTLSGDSTTNAVENSGNPEDAQLYVYNPDDVTLSGGSGMKLFLFAPNSLVSMGSDAIFNGTIWAKTWKGSGSAIFTQGKTDITKTKLDIKASQSTTMDIYNEWQRQSMN
ncbi:MAG: hypothetical protein QNJ33_08555 [Crocosphaera sp.]|nr:hypothetical protein [Crocosphaera sp.]